MRRLHDWYWESQFGTGLGTDRLFRTVFPTRFENFAKVDLNALHVIQRARQLLRRISTAMTTELLSNVLKTKMSVTLKLWKNFQGQVIGPGLVIQSVRSWWIWKKSLGTTIINLKTPILMVRKGLLSSDGFLTLGCSRWVFICVNWSDTLVPIKFRISIEVAH